MHYKNGREAKVGDHVIVFNGFYTFAGIVAKTVPGATSCNLYVVPAINTQSANAHDCLHVGDVTFTSPDCCADKPTPSAT